MSPRPRVLLLWHSLTGYAAAGIRALADRAEVTVVARPPDPLAPYDYAALDLNGAELVIAEWPRSFSFVNGLVEQFRPDIAATGDRNTDMVRALHRARRRYGTTVVMVNDYHWLGSPRQRVFQALFTVIRPYAFDVAFVPGARGAEYVRRLGFRPDAIRTGLFTLDHNRFTEVAEGSTARWADPSFLFCGRLSPDKAPDILAEAYAIYRDRVGSPWPLHVVGRGDFDGGLRGAPGVVLHDFIQPDVLPTMYADAAALILPSRFDAWGVVALEACTAGLPVVVSDGCGVASELATPANGFTVSAGDPASLAGALTTLAAASVEQRRAWGRASSELASAFAPERWADALLSARH